MNGNLAQNRAITLMELIVAIILLSMIVLYFSALEQIGRRTTFLAERKSQVQNDASFVLEHMRQHFLQIIGDKNMVYNGNNINPVFIVTTGGGKRKLIKFWYDRDQDGQYNGDNSNHDWIGCYSIRQANQDIVRFDEHANNYNTNGACGGGEILSKHITSLTTQPVSIPDAPFNLISNYITITVTACWDPQQTMGNCGDERADNPQVTMRTTVAMPSVSLH